MANFNEYICNGNSVNDYKALTVTEELDKVQNIIESCLQQYMSLNEVVDTLSVTFNVEPAYTRIVWQKLAEQNQEFFKQYNLRLIVKDQVQKYNSLLETQGQMLCQSAHSSMTLVFRSNGSHVTPFAGNLESSSYVSCYSGSMVPDESPSAVFNGNVSYNNTMMVQNSNMGMMQGINRTSAGSQMLANGMLGTYLPGLQGPSLSSPEECLRVPPLSDFARNLKT